MTGADEPGLGPRFAAWRVLHDVRHGVPFDVALRRAVKDLDTDDRRLAHELAAGVFRARTHLDSSLAGGIERGIDSVKADTLDVLRLGAFQLLHLDRVPPMPPCKAPSGWPGGSEDARSRGSSMRCSAEWRTATPIGLTWGEPRVAPRCCPASFPTPSGWWRDGWPGSGQRKPRPADLEQHPA